MRIKAQDVVQSLMVNVLKQTDWVPTDVELGFMIGQQNCLLAVDRSEVDFLLAARRAKARVRRAKDCDIATACQSRRLFRVATRSGRARPRITVKAVTSW
jgi:hypothetical protein